MELARTFCPSEVNRIEKIRSEFSSDLAASIAATVAKHRLGYVPASVELADADPSAVSLMLTLVHVDGVPTALLRKTFEDYVRTLEGRIDGTRAGEAYAPYEIRNVEALVRLGMREAAHDLLRYLTRDMRPQGWRQFAEVVWREARAPRFIGDSPHAWIGAEYIQAMRSLFLYEDLTSERLVLGAGLAPAWLGGEGVEISDWPTRFGKVSYRMRLEGEKSITVDLRGEMPTPSNGLVVEPPPGYVVGAVTLNGRAVPSLSSEGGPVHVSAAVLKELGADRPTSGPRDQAQTSVSPRVSSPAIPRGQEAKGAGAVDPVRTVQGVQGGEGGEAAPQARLWMDAPKHSWLGAVLGVDPEVVLTAHAMSPLATLEGYSMASRAPEARVRIAAGLLDTPIRTRLARESLADLAALLTSEHVAWLAEAVGLEAFNAGFRGNPNCVGRVSRALSAKSRDELLRLFQVVREGLGPRGLEAFYAHNPWRFFDLLDAFDPKVTASDLRDLATLLGAGDLVRGRSALLEGMQTNDGTAQLLRLLPALRAVAHRYGTSMVEAAFRFDPGRLVPFVETLQQLAGGRPREDAQTGRNALPRNDVQASGGVHASDAALPFEEVLAKLDQLVGHTNVASFLSSPAKAGFLAQVLGQVDRLLREKSAAGLGDDEVAELLHRNMIPLSVNLTLAPPAPRGATPAFAAR